MTARRRRKERGKALCLSCWNVKEVRCRKFELGHFLNQHGVEICLLSEKFPHTGQAFLLANYVCHRTQRLTASGGRKSHLGSPWYSPPLIARSGSEPLGCYYHSSHIGRQTHDNPCGLPFAFPSTDRSGPDRLFRLGNEGLDGRRPQYQTSRLEFAADNETGNSYVIMHTTPV